MIIPYLRHTLGRGLRELHKKDELLAAALVPSGTLRDRYPILWDGHLARPRIIEISGKRKTQWLQPWECQVKSNATLSANPT